MLAPVLLPNYLAYAGWGVLRGPGSMLGDWIARRDPWVSVWAGEAFAVFGLALWAWPIASLVMGLMLARTSDGVWESLRLEPRSWRVGIERLRLLAPALGAGSLTVSVLMTGSAVPLHVAQVQTYAIRLWKQMQLMETPERAFLGSGPLMLLAAVCAWVVVRGLGRRQAGPSQAVASDTHDDGSAMHATGSSHASVGRRAWIGLLIVWGLSIPVPLVLFLWSLRQWRALTDFWIVGGPALLHSLKIGAMVGVGGVLLACATCAAGSLARQVFGARAGAEGLPLSVRMSVAVGVVMALVPGVLVGVAFNRAYALGQVGVWFGGDVWADVRVALTHLARWGVLGVLVGVRMTLGEARSLREMRWLDERSPAVSWVYLLLWPNVAPLVGLGVALACLSMHEIESTIMVQPPGAQALAQLMLDALHFSKEDALAAGCVNLMVLASVLAVLAAWLMKPLTGMGAERVGPRRSTR